MNVRSFAGRGVSRCVALLSLVVAAGVVGACGDDDGEPSSATPASEPPSTVVATTSSTTALAPTTTLVPATSVDSTTTASTPAEVGLLWVGEWRNTSDGTSGPVSVDVVRGDDGQVLLTIDFDGPFFGSGDVQPFTLAVQWLPPWSIYQRDQVIDTELLGAVTVSGNGCGPDFNIQLEAADVPGDVIASFSLEGAPVLHDADGPTAYGASYELEFESGGAPALGEIVVRNDDSTELLDSIAPPSTVSCG